MVNDNVPKCPNCGRLVIVEAKVTEITEDYIAKMFTPKEKKKARE